MKDHLWLLAFVALIAGTQYYYKGEMRKGQVLIDNLEQQNKDEMQKGQAIIDDLGR